MNAAPVHRIAAMVRDDVPHTALISVLTNKYWHSTGLVRLTVSFMDGEAADLRARILSHMNAWSTRLNVSFVASNTDAQVRIARTENSGYWSYLGTDILSIPSGEPTMNLEAFTMNTPDSEFHRVVRHETGHTLGCPHEHMRRELVEKIDRNKAIEFFGQTQGWSAQQVEQQVLTPIEDSSLWGTTHADARSIMAYQIPGTITKDGEPIIGGTDIDEQDFAFMAKVYPKATVNAPVAAIDDRSLEMAATTLNAQDQERAFAQLRDDNGVLKKAIGILTRDL
ncbi:M12 family metallopeptidase [Tardiphaga sp. 37S4]|uniref:M12 family metallopeptidase n=1 Tax=Tardiphaga sp. 37S4 TaxID=1404741 RepID=UPI001E2C1574|nr:M12 family metallopeptidase [Tardiphaga sp. 37S4]UFS78283.1 M12 family metallopeptidase [Tardiphaga sp. 37S4]